ncbi:MAG TPA: hypothetical protein VHM19_15170 [Polyangiales bacterium]|jgi:DnaJ-class molecular chaperone|nr:hypothetical protein [Polyangiales bacterium]
MTDTAKQTCATCYGEGTASDLSPCPDCAGMGTLPSGLVLTEWRLRELERLYSQRGGEAGQDVGWLVREVRRAHHVLLQILAASQDADEGDAIAAKIKFLANDVLGMYPVTPKA